MSTRMGTFEVPHFFSISLHDFEAFSFRTKVIFHRALCDSRAGEGPQVFGMSHGSDAVASR